MGRCWCFTRGSDINESNYGNPYAFNFRHKNQIKPTENGSESGVTPMFNVNGSLSYLMIYNVRQMPIQIRVIH